MEAGMTTREWRRIDSQYQQILHRHMNSVPVKVGAVAEDLGLEVLVSALGPGVSGQISKKGDSYQVKVNRHEARERQRFTIAHEIGHFLLHRDIIDSTVEGITDNVLYRSGRPEKIEFEANRIAADILMPMSALNARILTLGGNVTEAMIELLASEFQVSKAAMEIRLSSLVDA